MNLRFVAIFSIISLCFSCSSNSEKIMYIASTKADCVGVAPQKCLQVKEESSLEWTYFYDSIEGFEYVDGYYYKLKVAVWEVENPPADRSSLHYKLLEVLEKSSSPLTLDKGSWLVTRVKKMDSFGRNPFIKIDLSKNEINGNTSCNRFSGTIVIMKTKVDISALSSTEMACRDQSVETAFLDALASVESYTLHNEKLQMLGKNEELLIECDYLKSESL